MTRKPRSKPDPIEREIELALDPGGFIPARACFSFVSGLEKITASIAKLKQSDPARAITLYETFLAGCYEKAEELDDSSGSFGQFVADLYCGWIEARQAAGADPDDTATRLLAWMDDDPYGFCYQLEKDAAQAFDKAGLAAFEKQIRARFDVAATPSPFPASRFGAIPSMPVGAGARPCVRSTWCRKTCGPTLRLPRRRGSARRTAMPWPPCSSRVANPRMPWPGSSEA